jgi:hypothetical protein
MFKITTNKEIIEAIKFYEQAKSFNLALKNDFNICKQSCPTTEEVYKYHLGNKASLLSSIYATMKELNKK